MKTILATLAALCALATAAPADILLFETGSRYGEKNLKWVGKVQSLDPATGLLSFRYFRGNDPVTIDVHVSRIYSITFDVNERYDEAFPKTRRPLTEPLPTNLSESDQQITLFNTSGFVGFDVPDDVRVRPVARDEAVLSMLGAIVEINGPSATLSAWNTMQGFSSFDLSAVKLRSWRRGL